MAIPASIPAYKKQAGDFFIKDPGGTADFCLHFKGAIRPSRYANAPCHWSVKRHKQDRLEYMAMYINRHVDLKDPHVLAYMKFLYRHSPWRNLIVNSAPRSIVTHRMLMITGDAAQEHFMQLAVAIRHLWEYPRFHQLYGRVLEHKCNPNAAWLLCKNIFFEPGKKRCRLNNYIGTHDSINVDCMDNGAVGLFVNGDLYEPKDPTKMSESCHYTTFSNSFYVDNKRLNAMKKWLDAAFTLEEAPKVEKVVRNPFMAAKRDPEPRNNGKEMDSDLCIPNIAKVSLQMGEHYAQQIAAA